MPMHRLRRWLRAVHLWLGLTVGAVLALAGLTGTVLVFYPELDGLAVPARASDTRPIGAAELARVEAALRHLHDRGEWRLELPRAAGDAIVARHLDGRAGFAPLMVAVDPASGAVLWQRRWGATGLSWIYDLHYTLLAGETGRLVLALTAIAALPLLLGGLWLWWPPPGRRLRALWPPRLRPGLIRRLYDLHVLAGVYGGAALLPLLLTGLVLERPGWFGAADHGGHQAAIGSPSAVQAAQVAQAVFPAAELRWIYLPADGGARVRLYQNGEPSRRFPATSVWLDGDNRVTALCDARDRTGRDTFFAWQHPLHNGEAFGLPGRIVAALTGLVPALLLASGLWRWRRKAASRSAAAARTAANGNRNHCGGGADPS